MTYSRVKKYQELRDGLKDEVAISKENRQEKLQVEEEDDFLSFMKKDKKDFQKQYRIPIHTLPFMEDPLHLKEAERLFLKTLV